MVDKNQVWLKGRHGRYHPILEPLPIKWVAIPLIGVHYLTYNVPSNANRANRSGYFRTGVICSTVSRPEAVGEKACVPRS